MCHLTHVHFAWPHDSQTRDVNSKQCSIFILTVVLVQRDSRSQFRVAHELRGTLPLPVSTARAFWTLQVQHHVSLLGASALALPSGIPADNIARLEKAKPQLEITHNGNQVVVKTVVGDKNFTNTITLGQDSKASLPGGIEYTVRPVVPVRQWHV